MLSIYFIIRSEVIEDQMSTFKSIANEIVQEVGYLALTIENAAAFIRSANLDLIEFLPIYRKSRNEILLRPSSNKHTYPDPVAATFLLSFEKVKSDLRSTRTVVAVLSDRKTSRER